MGVYMFMQAKYFCLNISAFILNEAVLSCPRVVIKRDFSHRNYFPIFWK